MIHAIVLSVTLQVVPSDVIAKVREEIDKDETEFQYVETLTMHGGRIPYLRWRLRRPSEGEGGSWDGARQNRELVQVELFDCGDIAGAAEKLGAVRAEVGGIVVPTLGDEAVLRSHSGRAHISLRAGRYQVEVGAPGEPAARRFAAKVVEALRLEPLRRPVEKHAESPEAPKPTKSE